MLAQGRWRMSAQAGRAGSQRHAHTTPLNNGWSEAAAGPPGDIIAASLVQLRQVGGGGGGTGGGGLVQSSVTEREREKGGHNEGETYLQTELEEELCRIMAAAWKKLCSNVLLLLAACGHGSASECFCFMYDCVHERETERIVCTCCLFNPVFLVPPLN